MLRLPRDYVHHDGGRTLTANDHHRCPDFAGILFEPISSLLFTYKSPCQHPPTIAIHFGLPAAKLSSLGRMKFRLLFMNYSIGYLPPTQTVVVNVNGVLLALTDPSLSSKHTADLLGA